MEPSELQRLLSQANDAHAEGDEAGARAALEAILASDPGSVPARALLTRLFPDAAAQLPPPPAPTSRPWGFGEEVQPGPGPGADWSAAIEDAWGQPVGGSVLGAPPEPVPLVPPSEPPAAFESSWGQALPEPILPPASPGPPASEESAPLPPPEAPPASEASAPVPPSPDSTLMDFELAAPDPPAPEASLASEEPAPVPPSPDPTLMDFELAAPDPPAPEASLASEEPAPVPPSPDSTLMDFELAAPDPPAPEAPLASEEPAPVPPAPDSTLLDFEPAAPDPPAPEASIASEEPAPVPPAPDSTLLDFEPAAPAPASDESAPGSRTPGEVFSSTPLSDAALAAHGDGEEWDPWGDAPPPGTLIDFEAPASEKSPPPPAVAPPPPPTASPREAGAWHGENWAVEPERDGAPPFPTPTHGIAAPPPSLPEAATGGSAAAPGPPAEESAEPFGPGAVEVAPEPPPETEAPPQTPPAPALEMLSSDEGEAARAEEEQAGLSGEDLAHLLEGAHELVALADFSGALELLGRILEQDPEHVEAQDLHERCESTLLQMWESKLGPIDRYPRVLIDPDEVVWLNLDHRAGFVLAQIDGSVTYEDLFALSGMSRVDTCRILVQLLEQRVVASG